MRLLARAVSFVVLTSGLSSVGQIAVAQPNYFWNGTSGSFTDSSRWSLGVTTPAGPPSTGDRALFTSGSGFTVSGNGSPAQIVVQSELVIFTGVIAPQGNVTGFPSLLTGFDVGLTATGRATFAGSGAALNSARPITVGEGAEGTLVFNTGAGGTATGTSTSAAVNIAGNPAGDGTLIISGSGDFTANGTFSLGGRGIGEVYVTAGGRLETNGDLSSNSAGLNIGGAIPGATGAQGRLFIATGGTVHNDLQTNIGLYGQGTVDISDGTFTSTDGGTDNPAISIARFVGSEGHLNVSGTGHVTSEGELIVGGGDAGYMTITDEGLVETFARVAVPAIVGFGSFAEGLVTIDGPDAKWTVTDALVVAQLGTGQVDLINGGTLFVESIDFENDPFLHISDDAGSTGAITVSNESSFLDASLIRTRIGADEFSNGRLEITDLGLASLARTSVGSGGAGVLEVNTGGSLITGTAVIGELPTSHGTATLDSGGSWLVSGQLYVGDQGHGELLIRDSATVTVDELISIGEAPGSFGLMTIDGPTATINGNLSALYIGFLGEGELYLRNESSWAPQGDVTMGEIGGGRGSAYVDATSSWHVTGGIYIGGSAVAAGGLGHLESRGTVLSDTGITIWDGGTAAVVDGGEIASPRVDVHGVLAGTGIIDAEMTVNNGEITPDGGLFSTGLLTLTGDYEQTADGLLVIEIGGATPATEFDVLEIGGAATLDGLLAIDFIDDFIPTDDDEFQIIDIFGAVSGSLFGLGEGAFLGTYGDIDLFITFLGGDGNDVVLYTELTPPLVGDYNDDGIVDAADYTVWRDHLGAPAGTLLNDPAGGAIGTAQYTQWKTHFGQTFGAGSGAISLAPVPEPSTVVLMMLAMAGAFLRRPQAE